MLRSAASRNFDEYGFYGVSVFVALDGSVDELCATVDQLRRYGQIRLSEVRLLRQAGFALLATARRPHFDIVLPDLGDETFARLAACFGDSQPNPARG